MGKLPVILVTGFLGSGKTTFLRNLAESHPELSLLFLVNEFADSALDAEVLEQTGLPTESVVGGSLFCECKAGEFVKVMRGRVLELHRERHLDAVIIETSGIADPEAIGQLMGDHGLGELYQVQRIVTIVAPGRFRKLLPNLPVIRAQIVSSDMIVINKTDLADEALIRETESTLQDLNPDADIVRAHYCAVPFSLDKRVRQLPEGALATCDANPFCNREVRVPSGVSLAALEEALDQLPPEILRIKGIVQGEEGHWLVERTVDSLSLGPVAKAGCSSRLVLIAHDDHEELLEEVADQWQVPVLA
ncbi:MAG: GTP-binding protein [Puniceicoccaceae bacterium]